VKPGNREPQPEQHIYVGSHRAVLLDDTLGEPISSAGTFLEIAVEQPVPASGSIAPAGTGRSGINRMLDRKTQAPARNQRSTNLRHQSAQVLHVVERRRAVDQVE